MIRCVPASIGIGIILCLSPWQFLAIAHGEMATFTMTAVVNGSLDGNVFTGANLTMIGSADDSNVETFSGSTSGYRLQNDSLGFTIDGIGSGFFSGPTQTTANNSLKRFLFADLTLNMAVIWGEHDDFATYNLKTAITSLNFDQTDVGSPTFSTTAGDLIFESASNGSLTVVNPEPSGLIYGLIATGMLLARRRRYCQTAARFT